MTCLSSNNMKDALDRFERLMAARGKINQCLSLSTDDYKAMQEFLKKPFIIEDAVKIVGERKGLQQSIEELSNEIKFKSQVVDYLERQVDDGEELPDGTIWNPNH